MKKRNKFDINKYFDIISALIIIIIISGISTGVLFLNSAKIKKTPKQVLESYINGLEEEDISKVAAALYPHDSKEYRDFLAERSSFFPLDDARLGKVISLTMMKPTETDPFVRAEAKIIYAVKNESGEIEHIEANAPFIKYNGRWYLDREFNEYSPLDYNKPSIDNFPNYVRPPESVPHRLSEQQKADYKKNTGIHKAHTVNPGEYIDHETFRGCTYLNEIIIPGEYLIVDPSFFFDCTNLTALTIDGESDYYSVEDGVLYNKDKTILIFFPRGKGEASGAPRGEFHIPDTVETIFPLAFASYSGQIKTFVFPPSVTEISNSAFHQAFPSSDYRLILNEGLKRIGASAFSYVYISRLELPSTVTEIGKEAFMGAKNLYEIKIPQNSSLKIIGEAAFEGAISLTEIFIPVGVEKIENWVFDGCYNLTKISLHNNIKSIGMYAFRDCASLAKLYIPQGVEYIGKGAFRSANKLELNIYATLAPTGWNSQWDLGYPNTPYWGIKSSN